MKSSYSEFDGDWSEPRGLEPEISSSSRLHIPKVLLKGSIGFAEPDQAMQIGSGDAQAAGCQRLVPIVLTNSGFGQLDLIVAELSLEGAGGMIIAYIDDVADIAVFARVTSASSVFKLRSSTRTVLPGARMMALCITFSSSRTLPGHW
jgi:hypothetical protein